MKTTKTAKPAATKTTSASYAEYNAALNKAYNAQHGARDAKLEEIARALTPFATLETRRNGEDDFRDMAVWTLKAALIAAYEAGKASK